MTEGFFAVIIAIAGYLIASNTRQPSQASTTTKAKAKPASKVVAKKAASGRKVSAKAKTPAPAKPASSAKTKKPKK